MAEPRVETRDNRRAERWAARRVVRRADQKDNQRAAPKAERKDARRAAWMDGHSVEWSGSWRADSWDCQKVEPRVAPKAEC